MIIFSQSFGSKLQGDFALGDGCWLPIPKSEGYLNWSFPGVNLKEWGKKVGGEGGRNGGRESGCMYTKGVMQQRASYQRAPSPPEFAQPLLSRAK